ncbi:hypothetical protein [Hymenobacter jeollabukensis]|uniref:Uncharacterized protein n=1 Tax=Hymenobacter jeollabukensis TaxID=2025313 RepID=A0A5R8WXX9_9BACT|nr:hypothetical protein [Hymenobacter jeollabukensis]TLM97044.1 hypothetical protein FDY95_03375 [Hymenobacter jeollabukensis]
MKNILALIALCLFSIAAKAQSGAATLVDTLYSAFRPEGDDVETVVRKLPEYKAESCLFSLLDDIIRHDKACKREVGYYFSCAKVEEKTVVKISPVNFNRIVHGKYFGYFVYGNRNFLCYGDTRYFVSKKLLGTPLVLTSFISEYPQIADIYLGGDTNGMLRAFSCNNEKQYALIKTCISPVRKEATQK